MNPLDPQYLVGARSARNLLETRCARHLRPSAEHIGSQFVSVGVQVCFVLVRDRSQDSSMTALRANQFTTALPPPSKY